MESIVPRLRIINHWLKGTLSSIHSTDTVLIAATPEAKCNLECEHCYWRHDIQQDVEMDWSASVQKIKEMVAAQAQQNETFGMVYAGRILSKRSERFLDALLQELSPESFMFGIVDNGYTIFNRPDLLPLYAYMNISVDGWRDAHDVQRRKVGSFDVAWNAILKLKEMGYDPIAASAAGPLSIPDWDKFDNLLAEHDVRSSVALVGNMKATVERQVACIHNDDDLLKYFEKLISGVPRLVNLYDLEHIRALAPVLKSFSWTVDSSGDGLCTETPNSSRVLYRPVSTALFRESELLWDGRVTSTEATGHKTLASIEESQFHAMHQLALHEREVWDRILK